MNEHYPFLSKQGTWFADNALAKLRLRKLQVTNLVFDRGSLTAALMSLSDGQFEVNVLSQKIAVPYWHEQKKLNRPLSQAAMIREVELLVHGQAVVFARTIMPITMIGDSLKNLGKTPLGHLLFKDGRIRVSKREFCMIKMSHELMTARRTPYDYQGETILVSEFFLPKLNSFLV